ncbi:hypothetical protein XU18_4537 [Perkinsela sp. CCAP 1560/4]|nr:hypothetical protein XU18_4537 [Perkinsela sp. CCAP 1560/4]|eukprot:KNH04183.1 hypothetical protein XU18_4537 [Perkinsela sp. CCAP 1560/4]
MRHPGLRLEILAVVLTCTAFALGFDVDERDVLWYGQDDIDDQTAMEAMMKAIDGNGAFCDLDGDFLPVCTWSGVECNSEDQVESINWSDMSTGITGGHILIEWLPRRLQNICIPDRELNGEIETVLLPPKTREVILSGNHLHGSLDCTQFPPLLEVFDVHSNLLHGPLDLTHLSTLLRILRVDDNRIHQDVVPVLLSSSISLIDVRFNQIGAFVTQKGTECTDSRIFV